MVQFVLDSKAMKGMRSAVLAALFGIGIHAPFSYAVEPPIATPEEETNREVARTYSSFYLGQKDLSASIKVLMEHLKTDPKDTGAWHLLGLTLLESHENTKASQAFYQALATSSELGRGLYLYYYADALNRSGDINKAKAVLERALKESDVSEVVKEALANLKPNVALPPIRFAKRGNWKGSLTLIGGYDTNVLLTSDSAIASISRSDTASPFGTFVGQIAHTKSLASGQLQSRGSAGANMNTAVAAKTYNTIFSSLGFDWGNGEEEFKSFDQALGETFDINWLNSSGYKFFSWTNTLKWRGALHHGASSDTEIEIPGFYTKSALDSTDDPANDRSGLGLRPSLLHRRYFAFGVITISARFEKLFAKGANYKSSTISVPFTWSRNVFLGLFGTLGLEGAQVKYPESSTLRSDRYLKASASLGRRVSKKIVGSLDYGYTRNISNVETARYNKHSLSLMVNYEF